MKKDEIKMEIANAIMKKHPTFEYRGESIPLPSPQREGTLAQRMSYATMKAKEITELKFNNL